MPVKCKKGKAKYRFNKYGVRLAFCGNKVVEAKKMNHYKELKKAYAKLHKDTIKEMYGSKKNYRKSLKERTELNRLF